MSPALIILVLTMTNTPGEARLATAIVGSTLDALGPRANVVVQSLISPPSDIEAAAMAHDMRADVIAEVFWNGPEHLGATVRIERARGAPWVERALTFRANDDPGERTRTVALTLISMIAPPGSWTATETATETAVRAPGGAALTPAAPANEVAPRSPPPTHHANLLSAAAALSLGVQDDGGGLGGSLDYRRRVAERFFLRVGGGARAGQSSAAQAVTRTFAVGLGLAWNGFVSSHARASLGVRADGMAMLMSFRHLSSDDPATDSQYKWLPAGDVLVEGNYDFAQSAGVFVGAGVEAMMGKTDIFVHGERVTSVQPVHPIFELGLRAGF